MTTNALAVTVASGDPLDVREFWVDESLSRLFEVRLTAVSSSVDVDFEGAIGAPARFEVLRTSPVDGETRYWNGICADIEQVEVEETGLSTYTLRIVPTMWLLTQRRNYRVFQDKSELDIVLEVLSGWGISPTLHLDAGSYPKRRMRVQYAETDFDLVNRLLEDIGVTYHFEQAGGDTALILSDCPNKGAQRAPVAFVDKPNERVAIEYVTAVRSGRHVRPGRYTQSDVDYRKALNYPLASSAAQGNAVESRLERYHHNYGSFLWKADGGGDTPHADDRGPARTNEKQGGTQVEKRLGAQRVEARSCAFRTIAHDLRPGKVFTIAGHPRSEIAAPLLVVASTFRGIALGDWWHTCEARYTDVDYRPALRTPKPRTLGVESATVTGPAGEEIHTDEFGRVRVHFHWDREGAADETSSCWVPLSQPWAGAGFGGISLARVGQEVLVDFLGADPDRPVVIGRVYTTTTPPPYQLPRYKMVSGHRSESYPRPKSAPMQSRLGGGPAGSGAPLGEVPPWIGPEKPAGGGLPLGPLGASPVADNLPGERSGIQVPPTQLAQTVTSCGSSGADGHDHNRSANGLMHDDTAGWEVVYLQAEKDFYETVKEDNVRVIGRNRVCNVAKNDTNIVGGYEKTKVKLDRTVEVTGDQTHHVVGDIIVQSLKNQLVINEESYTHTTNKGGQAFVAKTGILQRVADGKATILMTPSAIVIDAPKVYINPGEDFMKVINSGGDTDAAEAAAKKAAVAKAAQIEENNKKLKELEFQRGPVAMNIGRHQGDAERANAMAKQYPNDANTQQYAQDKQAEYDRAQARLTNLNQQIDGLNAQNAKLAGGL